MDRPAVPRLSARALLAALAAAAAFVVAAGIAGRTIALNAALDRLREAAAHRLDMMAGGLEAQMARFEVLPSLLEMSPAVQRLLDDPASAPLREEADLYLERVNAAAGAEMLYLLDPRGLAIAAADAHRPGTPVGSDLSFRPYVQQALAQRRGRFYGVGVTSGLPGYYLSFALGAEGRVRGIATVKLSLAESERAWRQLPGDALLLDERGVVILATRDAWRYRPLAPLADATKDEIARSRPYGDAPLAPLDWREIAPEGEAGRRVRLDGIEMLASERALVAGPWRLVVLDRVAPVRAAAHTVAIAAMLGALVLVLLALAAWQRRRAIQHQLASRAALQAAHDGLEAKVVERTAALAAAQAELVHAGKMATLGQVSAGMVHELNQPLAAMRTLSDNAALLLEHQRYDDVRGNLERIGRMVDRLGRLTRQLKVFARKPDAVAVVPVPVADAVAEAQQIAGPRLREAGAAIEVRIEPPGLEALGDAAKIEQVLVNLIGNAADALAGAPERRIRVRAWAAGERCRIEVADSGPGIAPSILPRLFEPFATSKPSGAGLGLGLMISSHLVRECGGRLQGENRPPGGAAFTIDLPLAPRAGPASAGRGTNEELHDA